MLFCCTVSFSFPFPFNLIFAELDVEAALTKAIEAAIGLSRKGIRGAATMGAEEVEAVAEEEEEAVGGTIGGRRGEADPDETSPADFEAKKLERRCCRPENSSRFLAAK